MLYYNRIDVCLEINVNKKSEPNECDVCHYWYFFSKDLEFQSNFCNRYHHLLMMSMKPSTIAILNCKGCNYHCIISRTSKNGATCLMQNADRKKRNIIKRKNFLSHIKMGK